MRELRVAAIIIFLVATAVAILAAVFHMIDSSSGSSAWY